MWDLTWAFEIFRVVKDRFDTKTLASPKPWMVENRLVSGFGVVGYKAEIYLIDCVICLHR